MSKIEEKVESLIKKNVEDLGYELYDVEYSKEGKDYYLNIYIDSKKGIDLNDCEKVNNEINPLIDSADFIKDSYFLVVSSPGVERVLRKDKHFNSFLKRYADDEQKFSEDNLRELISNSAFQEWLKDQDNNNKFLNFLLEKDYLEDYFEETIFIEEECGNLFSASDLYYNIDEELMDLSAFSFHLCYLSFKTRDFFKDNKKWNELIEDHFAEYDC